MTAMLLFRARGLRTSAVAVALAGCLTGTQCGGGSGNGGGGNVPVIPGPTSPSPNPVPPGPETFVGAGDIAICGGNAEATARQLDTIGGTVFTLGDNAYPTGSRADFRNCYEPTWGRHKARTRPSPGNHDYGTAGAAPYYEYFGANAGLSGAGYYSFDLGGWHIISLNSNVQDGAQLAWLQADLTQNANTRCTLAYWHHPVFSSGPNASNAGEASIRAYAQQMFRILYDGNAEVVLNGHEHLYERFAPQTPDGLADPVRGIRQITVGTGGVPLYDFQATRPNSEARIKAHGVIKLTLSVDRYQWDFLATSGAGDSGSGGCH